MAIVGLTVPSTAVPEKALIEVAYEHNLLGDGATKFEIEALGLSLFFRQEADTITYNDMCNVPFSPRDPNNMHT